MRKVDPVIWFVRHGESEHNVSNILNSDNDTIMWLTHKGMAQAKTIGDKLFFVNFDACYSSPIMRALQTASIMVERSVHIRHEPLLTERICPAMNGKTPKDFYATYGDMLNPLAEGTESYYNILGRVSTFLTKVRGMGHKNVLAVTHGDVVRAAKSIALNISPMECLKLKPTGNCEVFKFEYPETVGRLY